MPSATDTVTSVACTRASRFSSAVTVTVVAAPVASSCTLLGATVKVTFVDADSSSKIVRVASPGAVTWAVFAAVPDTVTRRLSSSAVLLTAVIVTVPVLSSFPAAIVSVVLLLSSKWLAVAGDTANADTVIVVSALDGRSRVALTVLSPLYSLMGLGLRTRLTRGRGATILTVTVSPPVQPRLPAVTPHQVASSLSRVLASPKRNSWLPTCSTQSSAAFAQSAPPVRVYNDKESLRPEQLSASMPKKSMLKVLSAQVNERDERVPSPPPETL